MRTINIYKFHELSNEVKLALIEKHSTIAVPSNWHEEIAERAMDLFGIEFDGFSIGSQELELIFHNTHGKTAKMMVEKWVKGTELWDIANNYTYQFRAHFVNAVTRHYLNLLTKEYWSHLNVENIVDALSALDFEYYEDGTVFSK